MLEACKNRVIWLAWLCESSWYSSFDFLEARRDHHVSSALFVVEFAHVSADGSKISHKTARHRKSFITQSKLMIFWYNKKFLKAYDLLLLFSQKKLSFILSLLTKIWPLPLCSHFPAPDSRNNIKNQLNSIIPNHSECANNPLASSKCVAVTHWWLKKHLYFVEILDFSGGFKSHCFAVGVGSTEALHV